MGTGGTGGRAGDVDVTRRRVVLAGATASATVAAGCASALDFLDDDVYGSVRVTVEGDGVVWSGIVSFRSADGTRVSISVDRALGSRSYVLPDDIEADGYDAVGEPITVVVVPERGVSERTPLSVAVACDGDRCGRASTTDGDGPMPVEVG
ncbi:hypothetical protein [Halorubellus sp. PRR65]|uniref:hypothetical protein n=1 Tax=Halorubellus sp. PRR65 TaxID=3098148 RepID=UPI002B25B7F2|nr:hypothetical protein [Halorubellus sp. PRR65]